MVYIPGSGQGKPHETKVWIIKASPTRVHCRLVSVTLQGVAGCMTRWHCYTSYYSSRSVAVILVIAHPWELRDSPMVKVNPQY